MGESTLKDITAFANIVKSANNPVEASLCLLSLLLVFQLRLSALSENSSEIGRLSTDFTEFLTQLRDALLGK